MRYWRKGLESYADYRCTRAQSSKRRKIKGSSINYNGRRICCILKSLKGKKDFSLQCRVREHWMGNIVILRIQSIPVQETESRRSFWTSMRKYWKRLTTRKLQKSKYRKILKTKIPETGSKTSSPGFLYFEK